MPVERSHLNLLSNKEDPRQADIKLKRIVEHGKLVESARPPDTFYNGWYPVRQCSFPGHPASLAHGKSTTKTTQFRDYKVVCDFCDKEKPLPAPQLLDGGAKRFVELRRRGQEQALTNKYWRFHDPHTWADKPQLTADVNMHPHNWFREQIDLDLRHQILDRAEQRHERLRRQREVRDLEYKAALRDAQKLLREQQKKCSFNNSIDHTPPPISAATSRPRIASIQAPSAAEESVKADDVSQDMGVPSVAE